MFVCLRVSTMECACVRAAEEHSVCSLVEYRPGLSLPDSMVLHSLPTDSAAARYENYSSRRRQWWVVVGIPFGLLSVFLVLS